MVNLSRHLKKLEAKTSFLVFMLFCWYCYWFIWNTSTVINIIVFIARSRSASSNLKNNLPVLWSCSQVSWRKWCEIVDSSSSVASKILVGSMSTSKSTFQLGVPFFTSSFRASLLTIHWSILVSSVTMMSIIRY